MDETKPKLLAFNELKPYGVLLKRRQVDRLEAEGKFPKRVPLSEWRVAWLTTEIEAWVRSRIEARDTAPGSLGAGQGRARGKARLLSQR